MEETYELYTYLPEMREAMEKWKELSPNNYYPAGRELSGLTVPDRNWGRLDKYSGLTECRCRCPRGSPCVPQACPVHLPR
jgi:hypothetical protein